MFVPTLPTEPIIEETKNNEGEKSYDISKPWKNLFEQQQSNMQQDLSDEGFVIPQQSGTNLTVIAATLGQQTGAVAGTIIFDPTVVNGGSMGSPNGQLKVLLADGAWHPITNT